MIGKARIPIAKIILLVLIPLTLLFIFYNSALTPNDSLMQSDGAMGFLSLIFPVGTPLYDFLSANIRKMAHFAEYFLLGTELSLYSVLYTVRKIRALPYAALIVGVSALIDETIQIFSGRGSSVADVWLDIFGGVTATLAVFLIYSLIKRFRKE